MNIIERYNFGRARKYIKVFTGEKVGQRSIKEFVDPTNGEIYNAKSWKQRGRTTWKTIYDFI